MQNIFLFINITLIALTFSACGGGGGDASFKSNETSDSNGSKISIESCSVSNPVYTKIEVGDVLVKDEPPVVQILHDSNDNKSICIVSGNAYLLRK